MATHPYQEPPIEGSETALDHGHGYDRLLAETPRHLIEISPDFAAKRGVVICDRLPGHIAIALHEGADPLVLLAVQRYLAAPFDIEFVDDARFAELMARRYPALSVRGKGTDGTGTDSKGVDGDHDRLAARLLDGLIVESARRGISDIHMAMTCQRLLVRTRHDGQLSDRLKLPLALARAVMAHVKGMAGLIGHEAAPRTGRVRIALEQGQALLTVSTLPDRLGERLTLHLQMLDSAGDEWQLAGMSAATMAILKQALSEQSGLVLVTGPEEQARSATLYACLHKLNDGHRNILTLEQQVKQPLEGVGQAEIGSDEGIALADWLRAILRQDPDVIMIDRPLDREAAHVALEAALSGHLVLASFAGEDVIDALERLRKMKIEPFLLASTLRAVLAQKQARRLCRACCKPVQANGSAASLLGFDRGTVTYEPQGCAACGGTGYSGQIGVFEAVHIDESLRRIINNGGDASIISRHAFLKNPNLAGAARALVKAREISVEDAIRISRRESAPVLA